MRRDGGKGSPRCNASGRPWLSYRRQTILFAYPANAVSVRSAGRGAVYRRRSEGHGTRHAQRTAQRRRQRTPCGDGAGTARAAQARVYFIASQIHRRSRGMASQKPLFDRRAGVCGRAGCYAFLCRPLESRRRLAGIIG